MLVETSPMKSGLYVILKPNDVTDWISLYAISWVRGEGGGEKAVMAHLFSIKMK